MTTDPAPLRRNIDLSTCPIRIARPSRDLDAARRFWVDGLGLEVLWQSGPDVEGGKALLMVGAPGAAWHLELVADVRAARENSPGPENLLVLYNNGEIHPALLDRLLSSGGTLVSSENPYWHRWGVTVADPDDHRLVLCRRNWP